MLRNFIITTLLAISFNVYGEYHFKIIGSVFPELNGKVIHLKVEDSYSSDRFVKEDSVKIQNGFFSFEGTLRNVTEYATLSIFGKGYNYFRYIMVDSGNTVIKVMPVSANSLTKKNKLSNTIIENSESYKLAGKLDSLDNYYYNHFATPTNYNSTILRLSKEMIFELSKAKLNLIRQFPNTFGSLIQLYIISNRQTLAPDELMSVYLSLDSHIRESVLAINFLQSVRYRKSVEIGQPIGELKSNTSRDNQFTNKNLLGKPYLIAFGATWCKPCKDDYPILKKIYAKYKPLGFEIVSVNLHDQKKIWLSQIESYSLSWIHISELKKWEETQLAEIFNVKFVPYYILVDKNGIIRYNSILLKDFELKELENYIINFIK